MRALHVLSLLTAVIASIALVGCDEETPMTMCGGHNQPVCDDGWRSKEGGDVRIEYILGKDGVTYSVNAQAWFLEDQTPAKLPGVMFGACSHLQSYENIAFPSDATKASRVWKDVGATVTLSGPAGDIVFDRAENVADKSGAIHQIIYVKNGMAKGGVTPAEVTAGGEYGIATAAGPIVPEKLRLPGAYTVTGGIQVPGDNVFPATSPITYTYTAPDEANTKIAFIAFVGMGQTSGVVENWFCPMEKTGSITVTVEDLAKFPRAGTLAIGMTSHQQLNFDGRLIDVVGMHQRLANYMIQ